MRDIWGWFFLGEITLFSTCEADDEREIFGFLSKLSIIELIHHDQLRSQYRLKTFSYLYRIECFLVGNSP